MSTGYFRQIEFMHPTTPHRPDLRQERTGEVIGLRRLPCLDRYGSLAPMWLSSDELTARILAEESPPVFIVGAGVAAPIVPGTDAIVDLIRSEIGPRNPRALEALDTALSAGGNRYQLAF